MMTSCYIHLAICIYLGGTVGAFWLYSRAIFFAFDEYPIRGTRSITRFQHFSIFSVFPGPLSVFFLLLPCSLVLWFNVLRLTSQLHKLPWQVALPESPLQVICWYRFFYSFRCESQRQITGFM